MKKIAAFLLCLLILTSCGSRETAPDVTDSPVAPPSSETTVPPAEDAQPAPAHDPSAPAQTSAPNGEVTPPVQPDISEPAAQTVSITVLGLEGVLIYSAEAEHREGLTVFDLLMETAKEKNLPAVYTGGKSSPYITGIGGLAEKQHGSASGWVFTVNGETVMRPCSKCVLNPGDAVEWKYITEFTMD